jgi:hypothetical protein
MPKDFLEVLDRLREYADYWFGRRHLADAWAFVLGHRFARFQLGPKDLTPSEQLFQDFTESLPDLLGVEANPWPKMFAAYPNPEAAFHAFFDLWNEYRAQRDQT